MNAVALMIYMDVHVPEAVTLGLRIRKVDIPTSQSDETRTLDDDALLDRATVLGRTLFTQDTDLLRITQERQTAGLQFSGVIFAHQRGISIGQLIEDLHLLALCSNADELANKVTYLPLR